MYAGAAGIPGTAWAGAAYGSTYAWPAIASAARWVSAAAALYAAAAAGSYAGTAPGAVAAAVAAAAAEVPTAPGRAAASGGGVAGLGLGFWYRSTLTELGRHGPA